VGNAAPVAPVLPLLEPRSSAPGWWWLGSLCIGLAQWLPAALVQA